MKQLEAIKILIHANKWRRGAEIKMPNPKQFGEAIDFAVEVMKSNERPLEISKLLQKHNLTVDLICNKVMTDRIYKVVKEWGMQEYMKGFIDGEKTNKKLKFNDDLV